MNEHYDTLITALRYLSSVCNYATTHDGMGYNKPDSFFGHKMAARETWLTVAQQKQAIKMLQKYRRQLEAQLISLPTVAEYQGLEVASTETDVKVFLDGSDIVIAFAYDAGLVERCRSLKEKRFDRDAKNWRCPSYLVLDVLEKFPEAIVSDEVRALADNPPASSEAQPVSASVPEKTVRLEDDQIAIRFPYDRDLVAQVKGLAERKFRKDKDGKNPRWLVPLRLAAEVIEICAGFEIAPEVRALVEKSAQLAEISVQAVSDFHVAIDGILPYQRAGVQFLELASGRAIIADQMGLGKTLQSLAWLNIHPDKRPAIIVVPASLKINWRREIARWMTTDENVVVLEGRKPYPIDPGASIIIINYDILSSWVEALLALNPRVLIADEAHYCKNSKAQRSKAVARLAKEISHTILLTGTPITNRPVELYPLLNMVDPQAWPAFWPFARRYAGAYYNGYGGDFSGATNLEELYEKTRPYVVRRTKAQVLKELPAKRRAVIQIEMDKATRLEYERFLAEAREKIAAARAAGDSLGAEHLAMIEKMKQAAARGKLAQAMDWITDFLETGEKLIVFATHIFVVDMLMEKYGSQAVRVTGADSQEARQTAVDRFQTDDSVRLFVGNIKAAGVGLTLTAASDVAFLEFAWTPGDHDQAEDRAHRIGQANAVTAWYLVAEHTIDEDIVGLLEDKRVIVDMVTDGAAGGSRFGMLNELAKRIAPVEEKAAG